MRTQERFGCYNIRHGAAPRSSGVHLSGILRAMALESGLLRAGDDEEDDLQAMLAKHPDKQSGGVAVFNRIALGLAWEDWYSRQLGPDLIYHPGEFSRDGIVCTPDAIQIGEDCQTIIHEFKLTWKSAKKPLVRDWFYWAQVKGYCAILGALEAVLHVMYVNGDYAGCGPKLVSCHAWFSREEVETLWENIRSNKDKAVPENWT